MGTYSDRTHCPSSIFRAAKEHSSPPLPRVVGADLDKQLQVPRLSPSGDRFATINSPYALSSGSRAINPESRDRGFFGGRQHGFVLKQGKYISVKDPRAALAVGDRFSRRRIPVLHRNLAVPIPFSGRRSMAIRMSSSERGRRSSGQSWSGAALAISISATVLRGEPEKGARLCPELSGESSVAYRFPRCGRRQHRQPVRG